MNNLVNIFSNEQIGEQIKYKRRLMGLTGKALGDRMKLSQQQISRYERGTQNFTIRRLCEFSIHLNCQIDYLLISRLD
ncbi:transcriptional repressor DicA [Providencia rustigianii]|uniref:Transcriptional repressor DicA n=1 Tax=Providencia rustigianii TaxID=158850 RepID=A0A379G1G0_9GAMM|nr:helix-turn-helix transcriptional regulator [Providencia rustigianii]SUC34850.1 transcriptional repressor DicA [Providencia rustigianii]